MIVRHMNKKDYQPFKRFFEEAYAEYLESLRRNKPQQYRKEKREKRKVTRARFNFYLKTGSSFMAEDKGEALGYVVSQTISNMHGVDKLIWIEYVVVKSERRRQGVGTELLQKLIDYAKRNSIDRIYTTINPDNIASIRLHQKVGFSVKNWKVASLRITRQNLTQVRNA